MTVSQRKRQQLTMLTLTPDKLVRLSPDLKIGDFDCGDADLNEFLGDDAKTYLTELLSVTYLVMDEKRIAGFFSLSNDKLTCAPDEDGTKATWNRLQRAIPNKKRRKSYPAVKVGRLGVCADMQRSGLGRQILDWLKILFLTANRTGCRFITVDAYNNPRTIGFYERNDFRFLTPADEKADTRQMYFDLKPFADLMNAP
jgi:GNAT superfamily N-acetyltransferase